MTVGEVKVPKSINRNIEHFKSVLQLKNGLSEPFLRIIFRVIYF